jgi:HSP20 family molecular chaperone IbpA
MPGIVKLDVTITTTGDVLRIQATNALRHYILETSRPPGWTQFDCTVTNGVLEIHAHSPERKP